jgi:hypothetical protein
MKRGYFLYPLVAVVSLWGGNNIQSHTYIGGEVSVEGSGNRVQVGGITRGDLPVPKNGENVVIIDGNVRVAGSGKRVVIKGDKKNRVNAQRLQSQIEKEAQGEIEKELKGAKMEIDKELEDLDK